MRHRPIALLVAGLLALGALLVHGGATPASAAPAPFDRGTLFFVQSSHTSSGKVEIHTASAQSHYAAADLHTTTYFSPTDASRGYFQMVGDDLWFIKVCQTASGWWELHSASRASGYRTGYHTVAGVKANNDCAGTKKAIDALGVPHLDPVMVWPQQPSLSFPGRLADGQVVEYWGADPPECMAVPWSGGRLLTDGQSTAMLRTSGTGSAPVDLVGFDDRNYTLNDPHPPTAPPAFTHRIAFRAGDLAAGVADIRDVVGSYTADVTLVKLRGTASGHIEVFADGGQPYTSTGWGTPDLAAVTWFPASLAPYGTWQLGNSKGFGILN